MSTGIKKLMEPTSSCTPCDPRIYNHGTHVATMAGGSARLIDRFIRELVEYVEEPVDWHYVGGRAVILTTGDVRKVRDAIDRLHLMISYPEG